MWLKVATKPDNFLVSFTIEIQFLLFQNPFLYLCCKCKNDRCLPAHVIEIKDCKNCENLQIQEVSHYGISMNIPVNSNERVNCNDYTLETPKQKSVIRTPRNSYCTDSEICGFEPITISAHLFETQVAKMCHKVPPALASHTELFHINGKTFEETIACNFDVCDVTNFLQFAHWHSFCFSTNEVVLALSLAAVVVILALFATVKCIIRKSKQVTASDNAQLNWNSNYENLNDEHDKAYKHTQEIVPGTDIVTTTREISSSFKLPNKYKNGIRKPKISNFLVTSLLLNALVDTSLPTVYADDCNMISSTQGKITSCNDKSCKDKFVTMAHLKPFETLCLGNSKNQISHTIKVLSKDWRCLENSLYYTSNYRINVEEQVYCPDSSGICNSEFKCRNYNSSYCNGFKNCIDPGHTSCNVYSENYSCMQNVGLCAFIRWTIEMESLNLKEVIKCNVWAPSVTLQLEQGKGKEIITVPSGVTKSVFGLDIDINVQGNNMLNFGPYFYKGENVKMFEMASHRDVPMAGFLGNLQCDKHKMCIVAEDSCKCEPASHDCLCEASDITERGISLPYSQGPFTVYQQDIKEGDYDIMIKDVSTDRISLSITSAEEEKEIFTTDQCEILSIQASGCVGCEKGGNLKIEYKSQHKAASIQCEDSPNMIQESPANIYINTNSTTQNIRCTLRCGKFQHEMTVVGHFKYVQRVNKTNWKRKKAIARTVTSKSLFESVLDFIINHWKEIIFVVVTLFGCLILLWFLKHFLDMIKGIFK